MMGTFVFGDFGLFSIILHPHFGREGLLKTNNETRFAGWSFLLAAEMLLFIWPLEQHM